MITGTDPLSVDFDYKMVFDEVKTAIQFTANAPAVYQTSQEKVSLETSLKILNF